MCPRKRYTKPTPGSLRVNILVFFFAFLFSIIEFRLFCVQVLNHKKYEALAAKQYWDLEEITPRRGDILTSDGAVLAGTKANYLMYGEPKQISDKFKVPRDLALALAEVRASEKISQDEVFNQLYTRFSELLNRDLMWIGLDKNVTPFEKEKIEKLGISGIGFEEEPVRYYPEGAMACHVLGFVASDESGEKRGYYGIEGKLNEDLKGKPGRVVQELDATGAPILAGGYTRIDPVQGRNVVLTLDRNIQYIVERKIKEGVEKYDAVSGSVIVMDPVSGGIYAMANYPVYKPDDFLSEEGVEEKSPHRKKIEKRNMAISTTYEPGSVMKPLTISGAIDLALVRPGTTFEDNGPVWYSGYLVDNWDGKHYGTQTIVQLLQKSNNIGAAWVGHQLGAKNLHKYFGDFGIGEISGIDLEGEDSGILRNPGELSDVGIANISFGQGVSATPLQVLNAFNAIANGGYLVRPKIIEKVVDGTKEIPIPVKVIRKVITKETSSTMIDLLEKAAVGGEAKFYVLKTYRIAGKTGTGQIPVGGKYDLQKTNATFAGFMSGSNKFSMIVRLEEPRTSVYAAETAVPLWMDVASELIKIFGLPPDRAQVSI